MPKIFLVVGKKDFATHTLMILSCHFGGPRILLCIHPVVKFISGKLKEIHLNALVTIRNVGGTTFSCVYDNCDTNVAVYGKSNAPVKRFFYYSAIANLHTIT